MTETSGGVDASEDRELFERGDDPDELFVACGPGLARVTVAGDRLGGFTLVRRCTAHGVATAGGRVIVATEDGVFASDDTGGETLDFDRLGDVSGTTAIGADDTSVFAASDGGTVWQWTGEDWDRVGAVSGPRRFDGSLLAAADGVYRVGETLASLGLEGVRDCADPPGRQFAATGDGLYRYDGDWVCEFDGGVDVVAARDGRVHAVDRQGVLERDSSEWRRLGESGDEVPIDVGYGDRACGVTGDGSVLVEPVHSIRAGRDSGWRSYQVGLQDAVALAVR